MLLYFSSRSSLLLYTLFGFAVGQINVVTGLLSGVGASGASSVEISVATAGPSAASSVRVSAALSIATSRATSVGSSVASTARSSAAIATSSSTPLCSSDFTITSQTTADQLRSCITFRATIYIDSSLPITLNGVASIYGNLVLTNAPSITAFTAADLSQVIGNITINNAIILSTLEFPSLTFANNIALRSLPALSEVSFQSNVQVWQFVVEDTFLSTLIIPYEPQNQLLVDVTIQRNPRLRQLESPMLVANRLTVVDCGRQAAISFPNLKYASSYVTIIRSGSSLNIPSLGEVGGFVNIDTTYISSFFAPNLTAIAKMLSFTNNEALTNISMPLLATLPGSLQISNNSVLPAINFPLLQNITGNATLFGSFTSRRNRQPQYIKHSLHPMRHLLPPPLCNKGEYACQANGAAVAITPSSSTSPTSTNPSSASNTSPPSAGLSTGAKIGLGVGIPVGIILLAAVAYFVFQNRKKKNNNKESKGITGREHGNSNSNYNGKVGGGGGVPHPNEMELPSGGHHEKTKLPAETVDVTKRKGIAELSAFPVGPVPEAHELYGGNVVRGGTGGGR